MSETNTSYEMNSLLGEKATEEFALEKVKVDYILDV